MMKAMPNRPHLPERLKRAVFMEAGRRCAIPTCQRIPVDLAHIEPRKPDGSNDTFENPIALCGNCHDMYDRLHLQRELVVHKPRRLRTYPDRAKVAIINLERPGL
jgi:HNH endonuclease